MYLDIYIYTNIDLAAYNSFTTKRRDFLLQFPESRGWAVENEYLIVSLPRTWPGWGKVYCVKVCYIYRERCGEG